jgi:hypothetical protein
MDDGWFADGDGDNLVFIDNLAGCCGYYPPKPSHIPTLSQWGMIGMGIILAAALAWSVRRRRVTSADKI